MTRSASAWPFLGSPLGSAQTTSSLAAPRPGIPWLLARGRLRSYLPLMISTASSTPRLQSSPVDARFPVRGYTAPILIVLPWANARETTRGDSARAPPLTRNFLRVRLPITILQLSWPHCARRCKEGERQALLGGRRSSIRALPPARHGLFEDARAPPSIEAGAIVDARRIDIQTHPPIPIAAVIAVVFMALVVVRPPRIVVAVVTIAALHVSATAPLGNHAAAVMALHRDPAVAVQPVMDIHPPLGVMHVAHPAVGAGAHRAAGLGGVFVASPRRCTAMNRRWVAARRTARMRSGSTCSARVCSAPSS